MSYLHITEWKKTKDNCAFEPLQRLVSFTSALWPQGKLRVQTRPRKPLATPVIVCLDRNSTLLASLASAKYLLCSEAQINVSAIPAGPFHPSSRSAAKGAHFKQLVSRVFVQDPQSTCLHCVLFKTFYTALLTSNWIICRVNILVSTSIRWKQMCCQCRAVPSVLSVSWNVFFFSFISPLTSNRQFRLCQIFQREQSQYLLASSCYNQ